MKDDLPVLSVTVGVDAIQSRFVTYDAYKYLLFNTLSKRRFDHFL